MLGKGPVVWAPSESLSQKERSAFRISESTFLTALSGNLSKDISGLARAAYYAKRKHALHIKLNEP